MQETWDTGSIPGLGRSPAGGPGNPLQYYCLVIPWTEGPGRLQSVGSHRVRHNRSHLAHIQGFNVEQFPRGEVGRWGELFQPSQVADQPGAECNLGSPFFVFPGWSWVQSQKKRETPYKKLELSDNTKSENPNKRTSDWRNSCSTYDFKKDQYLEHTKSSETQMRKYQDSLLTV